MEPARVCISRGSRSRTLAAAFMSAEGKRGGNLGCRGRMGGKRMEKASKEETLRLYILYIPSFFFPPGL